MSRDRSFTISVEDYETEDHFRAAVRQAMLDCEAIGHREGGAFVNTPIRVERPSSFVSGGEPIRNFVTIGWMFSHTFMPAARMAVPEVEPATDDDWASLADEAEDEPSAFEREQEAEAERLAAEPEPVEAER